MLNPQMAKTKYSQNLKERSSSALTMQGDPAFNNSNANR